MPRLRKNFHCHQDEMTGCFRLSSKQLSFYCKTKTAGTTGGFRFVSKSIFLIPASLPKQRFQRLKNRGMQQTKGDYSKSVQRKNTNSRNLVNYLSFGIHMQS